ncbi:MAG: tetratricopeptide repeat protein, partial [Casimicrobiaceae bacterium]
MSSPLSRTAPCPCGSGLRYKHCCGAVPALGVPGAVAAAPGSASADDSFGAAQALHQAGRIDEAEQSYRRLLDSQPGRPDALHYLGVCRYQKGDLEGAGHHLLAALQSHAREPMAYNNLGLVRRAQQRLPEALACFDAALAQDSANALAFNNRGLVCQQLGRLDEALHDFTQATRCNDGFAEAFTNRANALKELGRADESLAAADRALALNPQIGTAHAIRGAVLTDLGCASEAAAAFARAETLDPRIPYVAGNALMARLSCGDWSHFDSDRQRILAAIDRGERAVMPFVALVLPTTPAGQQRCARLYVDALGLPASPAASTRQPRAPGRLRIAYLSADFRNHAVAQLLAGAIERHDRARFEVTGLYHGPDVRDAWRARIEAGCERFLDVRARSDAEVAALVRDLGIDILVELMGHTKLARPGICARRAAPVQVSYLGYPGTAGAPWFDYLIADRTVIPSSARPYYDEKIAWMPHSYQANDSTKLIAAATPDRAVLGLPERAFVFCCFNNVFKITPDVFDVWMRLLRAVPGSVLWLLETSDAAVRRNLRREAAARGVDADRLVFAARMPLDQHLARHRCADLFVDTFHYNAHTTASDALWSGLPVVTCLGETFAARVAASLLRAVGLPELVTASPAEYEALALALARSPERLATLRSKLA